MQLTNKELQRIVVTNIKNYRVHAGMTQAELAFRSGLHRPNIARAERVGGHMPSLYTLNAVASVLKVSLSDLLAAHDE